MQLYFCVALPTPNSVTASIKCHVASDVLSSFPGTKAVAGANLPSDLPGGHFVRRQDLLKPDLMSEVILLGFGALIFVILLLILVAAWTQAPSLV
jgi:hypothetical protein